MQYVDSFPTRRSSDLEKEEEKLEEIKKKSEARMFGSAPTQLLQLTTGQVGEAPMVRERAQTLPNLPRPPLPVFRPPPPIKAPPVSTIQQRSDEEIARQLQAQKNSWARFKIEKPD